MRVRRALPLLAATVAGAAVGVLRGMRSRPEPWDAQTTDPAIPPSESSATRLRDKPGYAQEDADQEPL